MKIVFTKNILKKKQGYKQGKNTVNNNTLFLN
jgi:hypothetical protein